MTVPTAREQAQQDACTGVATAFSIISSRTSFTSRSLFLVLIHQVLIVGLRTYVRARLVRNFGKDDACMVAALVNHNNYSSRSLSSFIL